MRHSLFRIFVIAALACPLVTPAASAQLAQVDLGATDVLFHPQLGAAEWTLFVSGPDGSFTQTFNGAKTPNFALSSVAGSDGIYRWELVRTPNLTATQRAEMAQARADGFTLKSTGENLVRQSGSFRVQGGTIVNQELTEPSADSRPGLASAGHGTPGSGSATGGAVAEKADLVVDGSLCVGTDCTTSESYGADTIRLKENNLRIHFDDTSSSSGSFPSNDWRITANDQNNGGDSYLSINDVTGGTTPFRINAGTKNNQLVVSYNSNNNSNKHRVGFGTGSPVTSLHAVDGNTPALRLEQDGSNGFDSQIWDIAGNEVSFFIRDITNSSTLPFRLEPGAPEDSLYIDSSGDIGIGNKNPSTSLHVKRTDGTAQLLVEEASITEDSRELLLLQNNGGTNMQFVDTSTNGETWQIITQDAVSFDGFSITRQGSGTRELWLDDSGNLTVAGTVTGSSSRSLKENFVALDPAEVLARAVELPVTQWNYKFDDDALRHIGPMAEDFHAAFGVGIDDKHISFADSFGVALAALQGLNEVVESKDAEIAELRHNNEELADRLARLEEIVSTLGER